VGYGSIQAFFISEAQEDKMVIGGGKKLINVSQEPSSEWPESWKETWDNIMVSSSNGD
jgi:hypothetical protein